MSTTTLPSRDAVILDRLRERYEESGYHVFIRPSPDLLPAFLRPFGPSAIAVRGDENIVIQLHNRSELPAAPKLAELAERIAGQKGWRLDVFSTADFPREPTIEPPTTAQLAEQVAELDSLAQAGRLRAAFLLGWSTLEAAGRVLLPGERTRLPLSPGSVVEGLATLGFIEPESAGDLSALADLRDRVAHGDPNAVVSRDAVQRILGPLHALAEMIGASRQ